VVDVKNGGLFEIGLAQGRRSTTIMGPGSTLIIRNGGALRVNGNSALIIEKGASLIIENGAQLQLIDGTSSGGDARIDIHGTLVVEGEIDYSGSGYFNFFDSHTLDLPNNSIALEGFQQDSRLIVLNPNTKLDLQGSHVRLSKGTVIIHTDAWISSDAGADISLEEMSLQASGSTSQKATCSPTAQTIRF
jgi:hypothetical protein